MSSRDPLAKAITHLTTHTGDPARCPDVEVLTDWAEGLLSPAERAFLLDHVASCPLCAPVAGHLTVACRPVRDLHRGWFGWRGPLLYRLGRLEGDRVLAHAYQGHLGRCGRCRRRARARAARDPVEQAGSAALQDLPVASERICLRCHTRSREGARFCRRCGTELDSVAGTGTSGARVRAELTVVAGAGAVQNQSFALRAGPQTIGRGRRAEINLGSADPTVSRRHACIDREGTAFIIRDLGSTSGTYVNGHSVRKQALQDGDAITIGGTKLIFRARSQ